MMNSTEVSAADMLLQDADFPKNYVNMQHPEDYEVVSKPFVEYIPHFSGHNNRLIVRVCWKKSNTPSAGLGAQAEFIPMSFVCDTGAPMGLYLSTKATDLLRNIRRIVEDETGNEYVEVSEIGKASIEPTSPGHAPADIIGLRVIMKLELSTRRGSFVFNNTSEYW